MSSPLLPPERMALLLATEQIKRRENPSPNITAVLIMALARLVDKIADEETQLQAIADAPRCEHGKIEGHSVPDDPLNLYPGRLVKNWCPGAKLGERP